MNFDEKTALEIHSMLINSIVELAEASRREGHAIANPVEENLGDKIKNSDKVFHETLQLARVLCDKADNIKTIVQNNPA